LNEENAKKLLFAVGDALDNANVEYFLYGGTCLGAVREKSFIKIDLDIDIGCLVEKLQPKIEGVKDELKKRGVSFEILDHRHREQWDGSFYGFKFSGFGEHGDCSGFIREGERRVVPSHRDRFWVYHKAEYLENLKSIEFYGRTFLIPKDTDGFLTEKYGNWREPHKNFYNISVSRVYDVGITFGGFDLCHLGHINLLREAKLRCKKLVVGVSSDERIMQKKHKRPLLSYDDRTYLVKLTGYADVIEKQETEGKKPLVEKHNAEVIFVGNDWKPETFEGTQLRPVIFLPRTSGVSSTWYREHIRK